MIDKKKDTKQPIQNISQPPLKSIGFLDKLLNPNILQAI
jgi:hypothetical protein